MFLLLTQLALAAGVEHVATGEIGSVRHAGTWAAGGVAWETTVSTAGAGGRLDLAFPMAGSVEISGGAAPVEGPGGIVAIDVGAGPRTIVVRTRQATDDALHPPLLAGDTVQRVTLTNADWVPDPALGFEVHIGRTTLPDIPRAACLLNHRPFDPRPICVVADARVTRMGGLVGEVRPRSEAGGAFAAVIGVAFAGLVGLLVLGNRWLTRRAKDEVLEAYVREEFMKR